MRLRRSTNNKRRLRLVSRRQSAMQSAERLQGKKQPPIPDCPAQIYTTISSEPARLVCQMPSQHAFDIEPGAFASEHDLELKQHKKGRAMSPFIDARQLPVSVERPRTLENSGKSATRDGVYPCFKRGFKGCEKTIDHQG